MNRQFYLILAAALSTLVVGPACNKRLTQSSSSRQALIQQARSMIDSLSTVGYPVNYRAAQPKTIRWDLAERTFVGQAPAILVPIIFENPLLIKSNIAGDQLYHLNYLTHLLFYNDSSSKSTVLVITDFPDSNYFKDPTRPLTGIRFIEDWYGHPLEKLLYTPDGKIRHFVPTSVQPTLLVATQTCYIVSGYNYSPELNESSSWTEDAGCSTNYFNDGSSDLLGSVGSNSPGGGAGGGAAGSPSITVLPGNSIIKSIKLYFQCFTNVGGSDHKYTVTVCVDQPVPGSRTPWAFTSGGSSGSTNANNIVNTGHSFLVLTENYGSTIITRNVGFYPSGLVMPSSPSSLGQLNDDQNHYYNVSGTFTVDNAQFFNILNFISSASTGTYNLNTNNCTTFVINALTEAGIFLPSTKGTWPGGAGDDPGDLGQDLKNTTIMGMSLNAIGGYSQGNAGQCD